MAAKIIPQEISEVLSYCPDTGEIRLIKSRPRRKAGSIVGCPCSQGYITIGFDRKVYKGHRIAWFLHYGEQPPEIIDHINGDRADNKITNLRAVTQSGNSINRRGHRGVSFRENVNGARNVWSAKFRGKHLYHGPDLFEAWCRRKSAENKYWASHQNPTTSSRGVHVSR